jgi:hypothetical protein
MEIEMKRAVAIFYPYRSSQEDQNDTRHHDIMRLVTERTNNKRYSPFWSELAPI